MLFVVLNSGTTSSNLRLGYQCKSFCQIYFSPSAMRKRYKSSKARDVKNNTSSSTLGDAGTSRGKNTTTICNKSSIVT